MSASSGITGFRLRLLLAMMLVVGVATAVALWISQNKVDGDVRQQLRVAYENHNATLHRAWEGRRAALAERSAALARKPRIHAALEDDALDLLYPNAAEELRDVMGGAVDQVLKARFYRFLDAGGKVIPAPDGVGAGVLRAEDEARLSLPELPQEQQTGYVIREGVVDEVIAAPITSTETGQVIACIVLGFQPYGSGFEDEGMSAGIWVEKRLFMPNADRETLAEIERRMRDHPDDVQGEIMIRGIPHLVLSQRLNPGSGFPAAHEVCTYSFANAVSRGDQLRWRILSAGSLLLLAAGGASHWIAGRLAVPVEQLARKSARDEAQRDLAEAALEKKNVELQRSMRFSADTSHQLKTPVTVLRAGLEELKQSPGVTPAMEAEIAELIAQTGRISGMIHDLLLLSRLDAGRLELEQGEVDLHHLVESLVDDLTVIPATEGLDVVVDVPQGLRVRGEKRYTAMILQNLLENAWKYNHRGGSIHIQARADGEWVKLTVGNSGPGIPERARDHVFERFHRAAVGENVQGHGLGLNIALELALLHGGNLVLSRSGDSWTEFEVTFRKDSRAASP